MDSWRHESRLMQVSNDAIVGDILADSGDHQQIMMAASENGRDPVTGNDPEIGKSSRKGEPGDLTPDDAGPASEKPLHQLGVAVDNPDLGEDGQVGFDVVAIHGLHGKSRESWIAGNPDSPGKTWLTEALSFQGNVGRVIFYGYNAYEDYMYGGLSTLWSVYREAEALLKSLCELRMSKDAATRPIYFVSHDLGGLIVKAALILASRTSGGHPDIKLWTRALVFFGYPHRPLTAAELEDDLYLLLSVRKDRYPRGHITKSVRQLVKTVIEVNDLFLHTKLLVQAKMVNVFSTHDDPSQSVFDSFTAQFGIPFEARLPTQRPHLELTRSKIPESLPSSFPVNESWLGIVGDLSDEEIKRFPLWANQTAPVYPSLHRVTTDDIPGLESLFQMREGILHLRCLSNARWVSENVRSQIDQKLGSTSVRFFAFNSHDVRFRNATAMLGTFATQIFCQQPRAAKIFNRPLFGNDARPKLSWTREGTYAAWNMQSQLSFRNGVHILGCLDECDESARWFLRRLCRDMTTIEEQFKFVVITTKETPGDKLVADTLSEFPPKVVVTVDYHPVPAPPTKLQSGASVHLWPSPNISEKFQSDFKALLSTCENDESLCLLLVEWLKQTPDPQRSISSLLTDFKPLGLESVFSTILADIPVQHHEWAELLLSWMLSSLRPLTVSEFCYVSRICVDATPKDEVSRYRAQNNNATLQEVLGLFGGLLVSVNHEIQFSHEAIRPWLESGDSGLGLDGKQIWYQPKPDRDRHMDILQVCMTHLNVEVDDISTWSERLPYATEFWSKHYKLGNDGGDILGIIIDHPARFRRWLNAYMALPSPYTKPLESHTSPMSILAHLGLEDLLQIKLAQHPTDWQGRRQALVEASRAGEEASLALVLESYPSSLECNDSDLHEAVKGASRSDNAEVFRRLVGSINLPTTVPVVLNTLHEARKIDVLEDSSHQASSTSYHAMQDGVTERNVEAEDNGNLVDASKWLADALSQASFLGLDETVSKLLSLGADPNAERTLLGRRTPLHIAVNWNHPTVAKVLIAAGGDLTATTMPSMFTPLHLANGADTARILLQNGASTNSEDSFKETPLQACSGWGRVAALEVLLQDKSVQDHLSLHPALSPIPNAVQTGGYKTLETLLEAGLDPNILDAHGFTALSIATFLTDLDMCQLLLQYNADPNLTSDKKPSPLINAVKEQSLEIVKLLVEKGADIEKKEGSGSGWKRTPLLVAICSKNIQITEYLLFKKADSTVLDSDGWTPAYTAARFGCAKIVQILGENGTDVVSTCVGAKETPLHAAVEFPETVRVLLKFGADINTAVLDNSLAYTPFDRAVERGLKSTVKIMLSEAKTSPDPTSSFTQNALRNAVLSGFTEVVSMLLEAGADVNMVDKNGISLVSFSMMSESEQATRVILEHRPDISLGNKHKSTPLHFVQETTPVETVRLLCNAGADLAAPNEHEHTPLIRAVMVGNEKVVSYLWTKRSALATLNRAPSELSGAPLHYACIMGTLSIVKLLIEKGAEVNLACGGIFGTPLISATTQDSNGPAVERLAVVKYLLEKGAKPTIKAGMMSYPIISACWTCSDEVVKLLLEVGAEIDVRDTCGRSPIHLACYNSLEVINALKAQDADFALRDFAGRVPLHYAVASHQIDLVDEVLERSQRAGIAIDVRDHDNWTPLMWAARAGPLMYQGDQPQGARERVVSFLIEKGAKVDAIGRGSRRNWTASEIAHYHEADSVAEALQSALSSTRGSSGSVLRGKTVDNPRGSLFCDACFFEIRGLYFACTSCVSQGYALCFKCYSFKELIHPQHEFNDVGEEWYSNTEGPENVQEDDTGSVDGGPKSEIGSNHDGEVAVDDQFDDEITAEEDLIGEEDETHNR